MCLWRLYISMCVSLLRAAQQKPGLVGLRSFFFHECDAFVRARANLLRSYIRSRAVIVPAECTHMPYVYKQTRGREGISVVHMGCSISQWLSCLESNLKWTQLPPNYSAKTVLTWVCLLSTIGDASHASWQLLHLENLVLQNKLSCRTTLHYITLMLILSDSREGK